MNSLVRTYPDHFGIAKSICECGGKTFMFVFEEEDFDGDDSSILLNLSQTSVERLYLEIGNALASSTETDMDAFLEQGLIELDISHLDEDEH